MKKTFIILAFLSSFLIGLKVNSATTPISLNGHSIRKVNVITDPSTVYVGKSSDLTIKFVLRSKTGISKTRVKLFVNNGSVSLSGNVLELENITDDTDLEENVETYAGTISLKDFTFGRTTNEIKLQYLLSSITSNSVLAQAGKSKTAISSGNNGGNGNGGSGGNGSGGGGNNGGSFSIAPRLVSIFIEAIDFTDNSNGTVINEPVVSTEEQFLKLTVDHDQRILDVVNGDTFNAATNPVLKNLKIYKIDPNNKKDKEEISADFVFSLAEASTKISSTSTTANGQPLLETVYLSNGKFLKERQNLQFVIDLDNFYARSGVKLEDNLITTDRDTIKIKAQELEITDSSLTEPINFSATSSSKKKITYTASSVLGGSFSSSNGTPSTVDSVDFFLTTKGKKATPKIQGKNKNHNLALKVFDTNGSSSVSSGNFTIPVSFSVSESNGQFKSGGFYDPALDKKFKIPFSITTKTADDLDLILFGTFNESVNAIFDAPVVVNGSSL